MERTASTRGSWVLILVVAAVLSSCGRSDPFRDAVDISPSAVEVSLPVFTEAEQARIEALRDSGGLRVATSPWPGVIETGEDGTYEGFYHELMLETAAFLDLPVEYQFVEWNDFFSVDGVVPPDVAADPSISYTPDVFERADIIMHSISRLPWRERIMGLVPITPVRMLIVTRVGERMVQLGDLHGTTAVVFENTSHLDYLKSLNSRFDLNITIVSRPFGSDIFTEVAEGRADFCIRDADTVLADLARDPKLEVSMAVGRPVDNCWAVAREDVELAQVLLKTFRYLRDTRDADRAFQSYYGISIREYFQIINYNPDARLDFTAEEEAYLESVRRRGGWRAAIDEEQSVYEIDADGRPLGLHYNLTLAVADALEVPLAFEPVNFREFFMKNGIVDDRLKSDPDFIYVPDLLDRTDFYIATMSPLEWRAKFLRFIPIYPSRLMFMVRSDEPELHPDEWDRKRFTILKDTSYEIWMRENLDMSTIELVYSETGLDQARLVSEGVVDVTISDANLALTRFYTYPNLTIFPADDALDELSWAVAKDDIVLASVLEKTIDLLKADLTFETLWSTYYGTSFSEYLTLISPES